MAKPVDLTGQRMGLLVALKRIPTGKNSKWLCRCDCGVEKTVDKPSWGKVRSCGCAKSQLQSQMLTRHGKSFTPVHNSWRSMNGRCNNPKNGKFHHYGGRGITVCEEWKSFEQFYEDMGDRPSPKHSLDRIDTNKGYSKENCRWATRFTQDNNRRNNHRVEAGPITLTITEWEKERGFPPGVIGQRLRMGWDNHRAVFTPLRRDKRHRAKEPSTA